MSKQIMLLAGILLVATAPAMAGGFIRGEAGRSNVDASISGLGGDSDSDSTFSLRAGYSFNKNFAVEGFYSRFYDKSFTIDDGVDTLTASFKLSGIGLGVVGKTDIGGDGLGFFLSGRAGAMRGKIDASLTGYGSGSETSTKPYFGVGAGYDFSEKFGMSLNADRYKGSGSEFSITATTVTLGLEARF